MARIVITGGAGFVGSQLGKALEDKGHEAVLLDNLRFGHLDNMMFDGKLVGRFVCRDVRDANLAADFAGADAVVHLAGIAALPVCQEDPREAYDVNVAGVGNVLEAARRAGVRRVIMASTSATYEKTKADLLREDMAVKPDLIYAMTKAAAEQLCEGFARNYGLDVVTCRFFNVYGPHQDVHRLSPPFTSYVARELVMGRVPNFFNKSEDAKRDYVHSRDVIALLETMLFAPGAYRGDRFNVCSGEGHSVPELYAIFRDVSGKAIDPVYNDPKAYWDRYPALFAGDCPLDRARITDEVFKHAIGDPAKTEAEFGWKVTMPIREGIASVYHDAARRLAGVH